MQPFARKFCIIGAALSALMLACKPNVLNLRSQQMSAEDSKELSKPVPSGTSEPTPTSAPEKRYNNLGSPTLALGESHSCWLKSDGIIKCWGKDADQRINAPKLDQTQTITSGQGHNCSLSNEGVRCWGENSWHQAESPAIGDALYVSAGYTQSCAASKNKVTCWGTEMPKDLKDAVFTDISGLAVGASNICVIDAAKIRCFGDDTYGLIKNIPTIDNPEKISLHAYHACLLTKNKSVACWGKNENDQTKVPDLTSPIIDVAVGLNHTCILTEAEPVCWGSTVASLINPPKIANAMGIFSGANHACVMEKDGVVCWGSNDFGQAEVPGI